MQEIIKGNRHKEQSRDGDAYFFNLTVYVDGVEMPISNRINRVHTADAYADAKSEILRTNAEEGTVCHAWLTRIDATSTDQYRETVFDYFRGRMTLY